jgi:predicted transcriptional regulator
MTTPTTTIRLPHDLRQRVQQYARAGNKTNTEVIVEALRIFFEREDSVTRRARIARELARLADIDRADPELAGFHDEPEPDPFGREP